MTMNPVQVERKVRQLDNDVQALYTLVNGIATTQQRHTNRFVELAATVDVIDGKVSALDTKVTALGTKVDQLDTKVSALDAKVDGLDTKVSALDAKVDGLDGRVGAMVGKMDAALELLRGLSG